MYCLLQVTAAVENQRRLLRHPCITKAMHNAQCAMQVVVVVVLVVVVVGFGDYDALLSCQVGRRAGIPRLEIRLHGRSSDLGRPNPLSMAPALVDAGRCWSMWSIFMEESNDGQAWQGHRRMDPWEIRRGPGR